MHWQSDEDYRKLCRYTNTVGTECMETEFTELFPSKAITTTLLANIGLAHTDLAFASCKYE